MVEKGSQVLAKSLSRQGIKFMFGIVGIPVIEVAAACQQEGIHFIAMRNEQAASYAAMIVGYLTDRPGVCLCVSGPGLVHTLAGMANAQANCCPLLVIGGASDTDQEGRGAFQEAPQVQFALPYCKLSFRPPSASAIPQCIERAVRISLYGRPGVVYFDLPVNYINADVDTSLAIPSKCPNPPLAYADPELISVASKLLSCSLRPLIIIGKGCVQARASEEVRQMINLLQLPFLPTPMGKGVVSDNSSFCVSPARSTALRNCDCILLLGARLNWQLHFGLPTRFPDHVKLIQVDICPEELHTNIHSTVAIHGHLKAVVSQLVEESIRQKFTPHFNINLWWNQLNDKIIENTSSSQILESNTDLPMNFYCAYKQIADILPQNSVVVSEGATTMDIGRTMLKCTYPGHKLDAGTYGTMGVGLGFAIAVEIIKRFGDKDNTYGPVVCIEGDSAFGFSGMEIETAARYQLPIIFIIFNNSGISFGIDKQLWNTSLEEGPPTLTLPPTSLKPYTHYEKIADAFGGKGYYIKQPEELRRVLTVCLEDSQNLSMPVIINIEINPNSQKKTQENFWLTSSKL